MTKHWILAATALGLAAAPALAQTNADMPVSNEVAAPDANAVDVNAVNATDPLAVDPLAAEPAMEPVAVPETAADDDRDRGGFPWGLLGLVGLLGLLGRRRSA